MSLIKAVGLFADDSVGNGAREFAITTWAVATPGAEGVGRLKAAKSGVATAQARDFCVPIFSSVAGQVFELLCTCDSSAKILR
jgi:hypothetical protein